MKNATRQTLSPVHTLNFSYAGPNANELEQNSIRRGT